METEISRINGISEIYREIELELCIIHNRLKIKFVRIRIFFEKFQGTNVLKMTKASFTFVSTSKQL